MEIVKKKLIFKAKKRGILENEIFLLDFIKNFAFKKYSYKELNQLLDFIDKIDEFLLFEAIFKHKKIKNKFIKDMQKFKNLKTSFSD